MEEARGRKEGRGGGGLPVLPLRRRYSRERGREVKGWGGGGAERDGKIINTAPTTR